RRSVGENSPPETRVGKDGRHYPAKRPRRPKAPKLTEEERRQIDEENDRYMRSLPEWQIQQEETAGREGAEEERGIDHGRWIEERAMALIERFGVDGAEFILQTIGTLGSQAAEIMAALMHALAEQCRACAI